jgi:crossover junction endodeoxyribonuclease RuvC
VKVFGIDPGSDRTGYGCVETDGSRHRLVTCGAISAPPSATFPEKLLVIHSRLSTLLAECRPDSVAIENLFYATNVRSALKLGHARGVAMLAAVEAGVTVAEYTPAEVKRAVVGYGRAEKSQVQQMIKLLLGLATAPSPHDADRRRAGDTTGRDRPIAGKASRETTESDRRGCRRRRVRCRGAALDVLRPW